MSGEALFPSPHDPPPAYQRAPEYPDIASDTDVRVPMRDGVGLRVEQGG